MKYIETLNPREAAEYLRNLGMSTTDETIRKGLEQGVFPFGDVIQTGKSPVCYIYRTLLDKWVGERTVQGAAK